MAGIVGYPYLNWRISKPLTDAQAAAIADADPDVDLSTATLSGSNISVANQAVPTFQLRKDVRSFDMGSTFGEDNQASIADGTNRIAHLREDPVINAQFLLNFDTDRSYDLLEKDKTGHRLLYVERQTGKRTVACVKIFDVRRANDENGRVVLTVVFKNSGGPPAVV